MGKDISRQTIMTLVVLTVVVSLLGTFTVYNEVSKAEIVTEKNSVALGSVKLDVKSDTETITETTSSGELRLTIIR